MLLASLVEEEDGTEGWSGRDCSGDDFDPEEEGTVLIRGMGGESEGGEEGSVARLIDAREEKEVVLSMEGEADLEGSIIFVCFLATLDDVLVARGQCLKGAEAGRHSCRLVLLSQEVMHGKRGESELDPEGR